MEPKEKAIELVNKYESIIILNSWCDSDTTENEINSLIKQCAVIAVDEMILVLPFTNTNSTLNEYAIHLQKYLEQVKHEIEKL